MSTNESCGNCRFYKDGYCRRRAPVLVQQQMFEETTSVSRHPIVSTAGWCGEWEASKAVAAERNEKILRELRENLVDQMKTLGPDGLGVFPATENEPPTTKGGCVKQQVPRRPDDATIKNCLDTMLSESRNWPFAEEYQCQVFGGTLRFYRHGAMVYFRPIDCEDFRQIGNYMSHERKFMPFVPGPFPIIATSA